MEGASSFSNPMFETGITLSAPANPSSWNASSEFSHPEKIVAASGGYKPTTVDNGKDTQKLIEEDADD
jgi:hypothetical protein